MSQSTVQLLDLPNEILFYILKFLDNFDVLYSLSSTKNQRLDSIAHDKTFSHTLDLSSFDYYINKNEPVQKRFYKRILPRIHQNVKCLIVDPSFLDEVFRAGEYPHLTELKLLDFQRDTSMHYFTSKKL